MFSNFTIGLLAGLGVAAWIYSKFYRSTGGNTQNALVVAFAAGVATMIFVMVLLGSLFE